MKEKTIAENHVKELRRITLTQKTEVAEKIKAIISKHGGINQTVKKFADRVADGDQIRFYNLLQNIQKRRVEINRAKLILSIIEKNEHHN